MNTRILYIDGIRGLLALWVALLHTFESFGLGLGFLGVNTQDMLTDDRFGTALRFIHLNILRLPFPVEAFIIISGYSLMLVVARRPDGHPTGGLQGYFARRVKRILPPYYGAVALSLLAILTIPAMGEKRGVYWDVALPALNAEVLGSHLLFLHNWHPDLMYKLNPPLWTIAVEEQIYLLFPLLLLPIWRRWGMFSMWGASAVLGTGLMVLNRHFFGNAHSWFLMLFGFGALGACISFREGKWELWLRSHVPWAMLRWIAFPLTIALFHLDVLAVPFRDAVFACGVIAVLVPFTQRWKEADAERGLLGWLSSPGLVLLGSFSYSLYLVHAPILTAFSLLILALGVTGNLAYVAMLTAGLPLTVLACYGFHLILERPFLASAAPSPQVAQKTIRIASAPETDHACTRSELNRHSA